MKTAVTATSIEAYYSEVRCGREGSQRRRIFEWVKRYEAPCTRQQIMAATGLPINVVTARVNALIKSGALDRCVEVRVNEYGHGCHARETVMAKPTKPQRELFVTQEARA